MESPLKFLEENANSQDSLMTSVGPFLLTAVVSILLLSQILNMAASVTGGVSLSTMGTATWTSRTGLRGIGNASKWGWKKAQPIRTYTSNKVRGGVDSIRSALQKAREVR